MSILFRILILCFIGCNLFFGQERIHPDTLKSDFYDFIKLLEETHPDPYSSYGGRVFFHKEVKKYIDSIPSTGMNLEEFSEIISKFISKLEDGHTSVWKNNHNSNLVNEKKCPLRFKVASDGLFINSSINEFNRYKGARLISINEIPLEKLLEKVSQIRAAENIYGQYSLLRNVISNFNRLRMIIPSIDDKVIFKVQQGKEKKDLRVQYKNIDSGEYENFESRINLPEKSAINYKYIEKEIMLFTLKTVNSRESLKNMQKNALNKYTDMMLNDFYSKYMEIKKPDSVEKAIEMMPSIVESFNNMLVEMRKNKTKNLIIDLRGNTGGMTYNIYPTLLMLFGDEFLHKNMEDESIRRISPLLLDKYGMDLDSFNKAYNTNYKMGDFTIEESEFSAAKNKASLLSLIYNYYDSTEVNKLNGKPVYKPDNIYVLTNEDTFSAGFHFAYYLWKMGAKIVGVPSSQAPNAFMEMTEFNLPRTNLKGSISNSIQIFFPFTDKRAKIFYPDYQMDNNLYGDYKFDPNAEIIYSKDIINKKLKKNNPEYSKKLIDIVN